MQSFELQSFTYEHRTSLLPLLTTAFGNAGGWVVERKTLSATTVEFRLEIQLRAVLELYASVVSTGIELTRAAHASLTELCTRCSHVRTPAGLNEVLALRMEIAFLEDLTLHSLLASANAFA